MRWRFSWLAIATTLIIILGTGHQSLWQVDAVFAQQGNSKAIAAQVYEQHPEFPLENQYVRSRSGKAADDVTLVSRLIEYHTLVKGRSPKFRLEWKTTLADYMGLNDYLRAEEYPGHAYLKSNPMEQDVTVVQSFNRQQRSDLIQALADLYGGPVTASSEPKTSAPGLPPSAPPSAPTPVFAPANPPTAPIFQPLPPSNGADLLRPQSSGTDQPKPTGKAQFLLP
ncbi:MAG: hypothetical protein ACFCU8_05220 [Thermosynechococcaceae cyanobacterium]